MNIRENGQRRAQPRWAGYVDTIMAVGVLTFVLVTQRLIPPDELAAPYILFVLAIAYLFGKGPAVLAFVLSFGCLAYAFPPYHGIWPPAVASGDMAALVEFLIGTAIAGFAAVAVRKSKLRAESLSRESESRYRSLIETMEEGFATTDQNYVFTYVNPRFARMLGCSQDQVVGHQIEEFLDEPNRELIRTQIAQRRMGVHGHYEMVWTSTDGAKICTLVSPKPIFSPDGHS